MMRRIELELPWKGVGACAGAFGVPGAESRLDGGMRRVHQSRCARALASELLAQQGAGELRGIRKDPRGRPQWPAGYTGSLAHTDHLALAATAPLARCVALGVDVEPALPLPEDADTSFAHDDEQRGLASADASARCLVFCARQCVHKALEPLRGAWLEFDDVAVEFDLVSHRFTPKPRSARAIAAFEGLAAQGVVQRVEDHWMLVLALFDAQGRGHGGRLG